MTIKYISRNEIDTQKWDECIGLSVNGIAYAYSWYLDIVADHWDALVGDDYQAVFPLVNNRRYGFDYIYQPIYAQQLGLFSIGAISINLVTQFMNAIPAKYRFISINFNTFVNKFEYPDAKLASKSTYHLDLIESYPVISSRYSQGTKNSISKAVANDVTVVKGLSAFQILEMKQNSQSSQPNKKNLQSLNRIVTTAVYKGCGELFGAYNYHNELCSAVFMLKTNHKAIYVLGTSNEEGRKLRAIYAIIDHYIHQNSENHLVLDFGESRDDETAMFCQGFGAKECRYYNLIINKLPWYFKLYS